jgi:enoyl-CoA hydratase/carnithine racemase
MFAAAAPSTPSADVPADTTATLTPEESVRIQDESLLEFERMIVGDATAKPTAAATREAEKQQAVQLRGPGVRPIAATKAATTDATVATKGSATTTEVVDVAAMEDELRAKPAEIGDVSESRTGEEAPPAKQRTRAQLAAAAAEALRSSREEAPDLFDRATLPNASLRAEQLAAQQRVQAKHAPQPPSAASLDAATVVEVPAPADEVRPAAPPAPKPKVASTATVTTQPPVRLAPAVTAPHQRRLVPLVPIQRRAPEALVFDATGGRITMRYPLPDADALLERLTACLDDAEASGLTHVTIDTDISCGDFLAVRCGEAAVYSEDETARREYKKRKGALLHRVASSRVKFTAAVHQRAVDVAAEVAACCHTVQVNGGSLQFPLMRLGVVPSVTTTQALVRHLGVRGAAVHVPDLAKYSSEQQSQLFDGKEKNLWDAYLPAAASRLFAQMAPPTASNKQWPTLVAAALDPGTKATQLAWVRAEASASAQDELRALGKEQRLRDWLWGRQPREDVAAENRQVLGVGRATHHAFADMTEWTAAASTDGCHAIVVHAWRRSEDPTEVPLQQQVNNIAASGTLGQETGQQQLLQPCVIVIGTPQQAQEIAALSQRVTVIATPPARSDAPFTVFELAPLSANTQPAAVVSAAAILSRRYNVPCICRCSGSDTVAVRLLRAMTCAASRAAFAMGPGGPQEVENLLASFGGMKEGPFTLLAKCNADVLRDVAAEPQVAGVEAAATVGSSPARQVLDALRRSEPVRPQHACAVAGRALHRDRSGEEVVMLVYGALFNELCALLEQGVVLEASAVEAVAHSLGFPLADGGLVAWASSTSLAAIVEALETSDETVLAPCDLLRAAAESTEPLDAYLASRANRQFVW